MAEGTPKPLFWTKWGKPVGDIPSNSNEKLILLQRTCPSRIAQGYFRAGQFLWGAWFSLHLRCPANNKEVMMKSKEQIKKRVEEIEGDDRYQSGLRNPATIDINAPLALIQLSFEVEIKALKWVLKEG